MKVINIIGAGPVGCYLAYLLSSHDFQVNVYEEHSEIGVPVQCTGIVTSKINNILDLPKSLILNEIKEYSISSKINKLILKLKNPDLIMDRELFDKFLFKKALKNNVKFHFNHKLIEINNKLKFKSGNKIIVKDKNILVGADGPNSLVSKYLGNKNKYFMGIQVICSLKHDNNISINLSEGKFSWIVPFDKKKCRVGVMSEMKEGQKLFRKLVENRKVIEIQAGLIPIYNKKEIYQKNNVFIVGDAATLVKATTGGGIIQGLISSQILADSLINNKKYGWQLKKLKFELRLHLLIRKILDRFTENDFEKLIKILSKKKNKQILEVSVRDNLVKQIFLLFIRNPALFLYSRKLFFRK